MSDSPDNAPGKKGDDVFELEHFLPYRLSLLTNTVSSGIARGYRERFRISVQEWRVLAVLGGCPGLTAREITERTAMDKVAVSRAVKSLAEKDMLQKDTDPGDRRRIRLRLTDGHGRSVVDRVIPLARNYETDLLGALSSSEQDSLIGLLDKLQGRATSLNKS